MGYLWFVFIISLCVGSFLNVLILRYPQMIMEAWTLEAKAFLNNADITSTQKTTTNLSHPRSHCTTCKHPLAWWHNIPVLSFILLKGQCAFCHARISWQYPCVELIAALLPVIIFTQYGLTSLSIGYTVLAWILITQAVIDTQHKLLPDAITYIGLWLGLLFSTQQFTTTPTDAIIGASFGYLLLWVIANLFRLLRKREGMGYGDFKMLAMLGAWFGFVNVPVILVMASLASLLISLSLLMMKKISWENPIPFGPFLALAGVIMLLWQQPISYWLMHSLTL